MYLYEDNQVNYESSKVVVTNQPQEVKTNVQNFFKDINEKEIMKIGIYLPKFTKGIDKLLKLKVHT